MFRALKRLHNDEKGLKTLETVAILAVAAIILAVIKLFWNDIKGWFDSETKETTKGWEGSQTK